MASSPEMRLWRVAKRRYPPFSGEGGLYVSGRWHLRGVRVVYLVGSKALGVLEFLAHLPSRERPKDSAWWWLKLSGKAKIETVDPRSLPPGWDAPKYARATQELGQQWLRTLRSPLLRVPSVHVPDEWNFLLNPQHPQTNIIITASGGPEPFNVDRRLLAAAWANTLSASPEEKGTAGVKRRRRRDE